MFSVNDWDKLAPSKESVNKFVSDFINPEPEAYIGDDESELTLLLFAIVITLYTRKQYAS